MQPIEHNYSEKRDFIRMKLDTPVTIRCEGRESVALCRDLSASGLLLEAQSELAPGDHLRVSIPSTHETLTGLNWKPAWCAANGSARGGIAWG